MTKQTSARADLCFLNEKSALKQEVTGLILALKNYKIVVYISVHDLIAWSLRNGSNNRIISHVKISQFFQCTDFTWYASIKRIGKKMQVCQFRTLTYLTWN